VVAQLVAALLGVWLMAAPSVLGYPDPARLHDRIVGPLVASVAFVAACEVTRGLRRVNLLAGAWLLAAPLVLGYGPVGTLHSVGVGLATIALACLGGHITQRFGGGWTALFRRGAPLAGLATEAFLAAAPSVLWT
jgi:hypothetical protein